MVVKTRRVVVWIAIGLLLIAAVLDLAGAFSTSSVLVKSGLQTWAFISEQDKGVTAAATLLLAIITLGLMLYTARLWAATKQLVSEAQETSIRQLRAYVHLDHSNLWDGSTLNPPMHTKAFVPGINLQWRNTGETPAKNVTIWSRVVVIKPEHEALYRPPPRLQEGYSNNLGRGIPGTKSMWYRHALTAAQCALVQRGRLGIYVYGRIEYRDVFRRDRWTNFKIAYIGSQFPPVANGGGTFNLARSGNDTDDDDEATP